MILGLKQLHLSTQPKPMKIRPYNPLLIRKMTK
jgi:hypothetical protein